MKKFQLFVGKVAFASCILIGLDFALSRILESAYANSPGGDIKELSYVMKYSKEPLVIVGSSRARSHFIPGEFQKRTGFETYNAGMNGQGIFYHYCILHGLLTREKTKIILLDINSSDLFKSSRFGLESLSELAPFYGLSNEIDSVLQLEGFSKKIKLQSGLYRYNSKLSEIISSNFISHKIVGGYKPLHGGMKPQDNATHQDQGGSAAVIDSLKINFLKKFLQTASENHIQVFIVCSPSYFVYPDHERATEVLQDIARSYHIQVLDYRSDKRFLSRAELFKDARHLNHEGATLLSAIVSEELKKLLGDV